MGDDRHTESVRSVKTKSQNERKCKQAGKLDESQVHRCKPNRGYQHRDFATEPTIQT
jgi:hypothetical protein